MSHRDISNGESQSMFLWRNINNYPEIILVTSSYLHWKLQDRNI